ncbi:serine protease, partial [Staphylococcus gallinarum]
MSDNKEIQEQDQPVEQQQKRVSFKKSNLILLLLTTIILTVLITVFATIAISHWTSGLNGQQRAEMKKVQQ